MNGKMAMAICMMLVLGGLTALAGAVTGETEPNDLFTQANPITPGTYTGGTNDTAVPVDDTDCYKFSMAGGQYMVVNGSCTLGETVKFSVYDTTQGYMAASPWLNPGVSWVFKYTLGQANGGTYYIKAEGGISNYSFRLDIYDQFDAGQFGDAGDTLATARNLTSGTYTGWAADDDPSDYYAFEIPNGARFNATITAATTGTQQAKLVLYKPDGNYLNGTSWLNPGISGTIRHTTADNTGGHYVLLAESDGNNYTLVVGFEMQNDAGSGGDVSGDITTAYQLPGNGTYSGYVKDDDEADYFKFNVTGGQRFWLTLNVGTVDTDQCKLVVNKPDKNYLDSTSWTNPGISASLNYTTNNAGGGQYYIMLEGQNSYSFVIHIEDQFDAGIIGDAGDDLATTRAVMLNTVYYGWEADQDDKDYYSFPGGAGQQVAVDFTILTGTAQGKVTVYKPDKNYLDATSWIYPGIQTYLNVTLATTGTYYLLVAVDFSNYTFNISLPPDLVPPVVNVTTPESSGYLTPNVTVTGTAIDNLAVVVVQVSLDNATWTNCTGTGTWSSNVTLVLGGNNIYVRASDAAGNWGYELRHLYLDTIAPVVLISSPANGTSLTTSTATLTGTATDNMLISKVEVQVNGGNWVTATGTTAWTAANVTLAQGSNVVFIRATDTAGNANTAQITVTVDSIAPTVSINSPASGAKVSKATLKVSGIASDNVKLAAVELTVNGVSVSATGLNIWSANVSLKEGLNTIIVSVTDGAGLKTSQTILVTYTKPVVKPQPGFEALFLLGAVVVGLLLLSRKRN